MKALRVLGTVLMILGGLMLLMCALCYLLPVVPWGFASRWLAGLITLIETPARAPLSWLQSAAAYFLNSNTNALYLSGGVCLLGLTVYLLGRPAKAARERLQEAQYVASEYDASIDVPENPTLFRGGSVVVPAVKPKRPTYGQDQDVDAESAESDLADAAPTRTFVDVAPVPAYDPSFRRRIPLNTPDFSNIDLEESEPEGSSRPSARTPGA